MGIINDMSDVCGFKYHEYWMASNVHNTMTKDEWNKWYNEHCRKCSYMCETCMYGEERKKDVNNK